jgi:hypothetical protein
MTRQPKTSYTAEAANSRGVAETAADFARFLRGQSWDDVYANLPRNVTPWPDEEAAPRQPAYKKDESAKDDDS